jgi:hypothetical protein
LQAAEQAEFDLTAGKVDFAWVCSAFSLEDPLIALRARRELAHDAILSEGAACMLLARGQEITDWGRLELDRGAFVFGMASPLIRFLRRGKGNS